MNRHLPWMGLCVSSLVAVAFSAGCMDREPAAVCPVPTELAKSDAYASGFEGVDMLVVVDDSKSMQEEQAVLATAFFPLVNALVNPLPDWPYPPADNVRVAVVSSDMGLQWGGKPYAEGDGWPNDNIPCGKDGDNGRFQSYQGSKTIEVSDGVIPCDQSAAQCPTGWACGDMGYDPEFPDRGLCQAPGGETTVDCPGMNATWAETPVGPPDAAVPNPELAFQVSCLSALGTEGCGFEQQLQSAAVALNRDDQDDFVREKALLAVLVVSDEEDCSIESNDLFAAPEVQNQGLKSINLACGNNPDDLYSPSSYEATFLSAKQGKENAVVFASIVGVPIGAACEGAGHEIGQCLEQGEMQLEVIEKDGSKYFAPACERYEGDLPVTEALPGRRYVELAQDFSSMGYVYSICNEDWSPAMEDIARLIARKIAGTCYPKPLDWDPAEKKSKCDVVVEFVDVEQCPIPVPPGAEVATEEYTDEEDITHTRTFCPLEALAAPRNCAELSAQEEQQLDGELGWYYCENLAAEDFDEACADGINNDPGEDDLIDCEDPGCQGCGTCGGTGIDCQASCKYVVQLTEKARDVVFDHAVSIQCLQQFSFEDPNCQENTELSCSDGADNDGNGIWDCDDDFESAAPHAADPNCCPMTVDEAGSCVVDDAAYRSCPGSDVDDPSDACRSAAHLLACNPPSSWYQD